MNKEEAKKQIDADDASINGVKLITACRAKDIIDAIDDHQKVKLPREVGEELEEWLKTDNIDDVLDDILCVYEGDHGVVRNWWCSMLGATYLIADMARYGWEAEKEALYNVKVPLVQAQGGLWFFINSDDKLDATWLQGLAKKFTIEEIEHYGLQDCEKEEVEQDAE